LAFTWLAFPLALIPVMPTGYSLHIGLNKVDSNNYHRQVKLLSSCHNDAIAYHAIAARQGFHYSKLLLDEGATSVNFYHEIEHISQQMQKNDILFLSFSGHGSKKPSTTEPDGRDETWCFYDGQVLDDQLFQLWQGFKKGKRILVISDSCHSGTILRDIFNIDPFSVKASPSTASSLSRSFEVDPFTSPVKAHVKLLAAAKENRYAQNAGKHGMFTKALLKVWNKGTFEGNYQAFFETISRELPLNHPPARMDVGRLNKNFNLQKPFQINV